jgi:hypothetical protein
MYKEVRDSRDRLKDEMMLHWTIRSYSYKSGRYLAFPAIFKLVNTSRQDFIVRNIADYINRNE